MKTKFHLTALILLIAAIGVVEMSWAAPDGSQRLRGLGARTFLVEVEVLFAEDGFGIPPVGSFFSNCYFFEGDGSWIDPAFPRPGGAVAGHWMQHTEGASTAYTAYVDAGVVLWQDGTVTPAKGAGVLQLKALTKVLFGDWVLGEFESIGYEVDECPL